MANVFKIINDIYNQQVEENNTKGFASAYKEATNYLFKCIKKEGYTVEKEEFLDGYFIFGYGTNSVVHFHVKEIPGWKFGIWWNEPNKNKDSSYENFFTGELFAKYEENIDKFKPSYSNFKCTISYYIGDKFDKETSTMDYIFERMLKYMKDEPELAFCRDCYGWDAYEYHTREEAKEKFKEWKEHKELEKKVKEEYRIKYYNFYKNRIIPFFGKDAKIIDKGDNWSPRYDLVCKYPNKFFEVEQPGWYSLFDADTAEFFDSEEQFKEWKEVDKDLDKLDNELETISNKYNLCLFTCDYFHRDVFMYDPNKTNYDK